MFKIKIQAGKRMVSIKVLLFGFTNFSKKPEEWVLTLAQVQIKLPASMIDFCILGEKKQYRGGHCWSF